MDKPPLPTKIAAWWITVIIMIGIIAGVIGLWFGIELGLFYILSGSPILFLPCLLLFRRKKLGWYWGVITLSGIIIAATAIFSFILYALLTIGMPGSPVSQIVLGIFFYLSLFLLIISLPPFILLFIDRKNFWKIAT